MLFSGKKAPTVKAERKIVPCGNIKSGIVFSVKGGLGRLRNELGKADDDFNTNLITMLEDTPLIQAEVPCCPTCQSLLMAGYGIENADCPELRAVCDAINSDFIDIDHSFEIMRPLLGLLDDGYYLLADAECIPTDGEGHFFWDIDPKLKKYDAAVSMYYISEEDGCDFFTYENVDPTFLYPTQSASLFNAERVEYYREHNLSNENAPRAIAYNEFYGISALLDGHHKAAAAALNGQRVKCLLIIPSFEQFFKPAGGDWEFRRQEFTEDIFFDAKEFSDKEIAAFKDKWLAEREKQNEPPHHNFSGPKFKKREWEKAFTDSAKKYLTVRQLTLEKLFGIKGRFGEIAERLTTGIREGRSLASLTDIDSGLFRNNDERGEYIPALKLMLARAGFEGDRSLKVPACEIVRTHFGGYELVTAALRYLTMFGDDNEVEKICIDIISDADEFERYGHIALDFWEDVPPA
ncbi:hypothetical protein [uncultured Ruminococcus sp.]|uniref:hypothetical protein n=1 Tax=uncultured Ruminococcus sp. TaxID=165186 RepID=UPI0025D39C31|nr:hypothetical protein [uncultured Ruminococcus sp.]